MSRHSLLFSSVSVSLLFSSICLVLLLLLLSVFLFADDSRSVFGRDDLDIVIVQQRSPVLKVRTSLLNLIEILWLSLRLTKMNLWKL